MKIKHMLVMALTAVSLLNGCAFQSMAAVYDDEKQIAGSSNSYSLINVKQTTEDGHFTASAEKMEGMDTIWDYEAEEAAELDITYTLNVYSGKLKLVLINADGELSIIAETDAEMQEPVQDTFQVESGKNRIKVVAGEDTRFDIDISISAGRFRQLG